MKDNDLPNKLADLVSMEAPDLKWTLCEDEKGISLSIFYDSRRSREYKRKHHIRRNLGAKKSA
jgi:hypothetical protein